VSRFVKADEVRHEAFDWGEVGWRCTPDTTGSTQLVVMDVALEPGQGHDFHRHPQQDEVIVVRSGRIEQWLERDREVLGPGDSVYLDAGVVHASFNIGPDTAELQVMIGPAMPGGDGYDIEDVSGQEPWASLRAGVSDQAS
jgi:quercetin dioxygenase-like cupin family protein